MASPTSRTLAELRKRGIEAGVVERFNAYTHRSHDLFGFCDLVAIDGDRGLIAIQACAGASHAARRAKILDEPRAALWAAHGTIEIWSWSQRVHKFKNGAKSLRWKARVETITLGDFG